MVHRHILPKRSPSCITFHVAEYIRVRLPYNIYTCVPICAYTAVITFRQHTTTMRKNKTKINYKRNDAFEGFLLESGI